VRNDKLTIRGSIAPLGVLSHGVKIPEKKAKGKGKKGKKNIDYRI